MNNNTQQLDKKELKQLEKEIRQEQKAFDEMCEKFKDAIIKEDVNFINQS